MSDKNNFDKDYIGKTLNLYEEKSKTLTKTIALLLGVAIFFLFIIFFPYVSILESEKIVSEKKENVENISNTFIDIQDETNKLNSTIHLNRNETDKFLTFLINNYTDNVYKCNHNENAIRFIQINKKELSYVKDNITDNSFWELDVCNKLGLTIPTNFTTTLYFYLNDPESNQKKSKANLYYNGMIKQILSSPEFDKKAINMFEYYDASWHVGSPFWLQFNAKDKISSLFNEYKDNILKINKKIQYLQILNTYSIEKFKNNFLIEKSNFSNIKLDIIRYRLYISVTIWAIVSLK